MRPRHHPQSVTEITCLSSPATLPTTPICPSICYNFVTLIHPRAFQNSLLLTSCFDIPNSNCHPLADGTIRRDVSYVQKPGKTQIQKRARNLGLPKRPLEEFKDSQQHPTVRLCPPKRLTLCRTTIIMRHSSECITTERGNKLDLKMDLIRDALSFFTI